MAEKDESLRNEIDIELPYVGDDGVAGIKRVHIKFISQGIYDDYVSILKDSQEAVYLGNKINTFSADLGSAVADYDLGKITDLTEKFRDIKRECEDATARLVELASNTLQKKFNLIVKILRKNGVEDSNLFSIDWWKDCVQMGDIMRFLHEACTKDDDAEVKKKL